MEYTKRRNVNRGYIKLEVWNDAVVLFKLVYETVGKVERVDFKLRSQLIDCTQSLSANISEGYGRRTINEYLLFLNIALGSTAETMTRMIGLRNINLLSEHAFEEFDKFHYQVENKLIALVRSLQEKRRKGNWEEEFPQASLGPTG